MSHENERLYWLAFSNCHGIGATKFQRLLTYFGSAANAWHASASELQQSGIGPKTAADVAVFRTSFSLDRYIERMAKAKVSFVTVSEDTYPALLKHIPNPPFILYIKGNQELLVSEKCMVAVVGTRKITEYGKMVTELLVKELTAAQCIIVSGLAMGVDAISHQTTVEAQGQTIAVLGSGVDNCTPRENQKIYEQILHAGGTIISEAPLGQMPNKGSFPMRNRIIAGMSSGVLVTEGAEDSGSLITAKYALASDRPVFAVPGPITSHVSKGPIALLGLGARAVMSASDMLSVLGVSGSHGKTQQRMIKGDTAEEQTIIEILAKEQAAFDEIVKRTGIPSAQVGTVITLMEMKGCIKRLAQVCLPCADEHFRLQNIAI